MEALEDRSAPSALTPGRLLVVARRQWWVIVACLVLAGGASLAYVKSRPAQYSAVGVVNVQGLASASGSGLPPSLPGPTPSTEVTSPVVVKAAVAAANGSSVHLTAVVNATTTEIDITATAGTPQQASRAALAAATVFASQRKGTIQKLANELDGQVSSLANQINTLGKELKTDEAAGQQLQVVDKSYGAAAGQQLNFQNAATAISADTTPPVAFKVGTSKKKVLELALLAGLIIGCGIALVADHLDDRLRSAAELAEIGDVALLAELPSRPPAERFGFDTVTNSHDGLSEAVRELRTALRFLSVEKPIRVLLVTSPAAAEGKSFVAANLAAALAISGTRTILVSSDLRRPRLEDLIDSDASSINGGLSEAIANAALQERSARQNGEARPANGSSTNGGSSRPPRRRTDVSDLLVPTGIENLWLVPAGPSPPNPAELLGSSHMAAVIDELRARSDIVILDSPPVLAVTDALVLTAHADGVLMVMAKGQTSRGAARRALQLLESGLAPVFGVALNRSTRSDIVPYPYYEASGRLDGPRRRISLRRPLPMGAGSNGAQAGAESVPGPRR
jgi:Mrp family chromosome partitioning ATPase/capsular polysaccharide biosynthesis protein